MSLRDHVANQSCFPSASIAVQLFNLGGGDNGFNGITLSFPMGIFPTKELLLAVFSEMYQPKPDQTVHALFEDGSIEELTKGIAAGKVPSFIARVTTHAIGFIQGAPASATRPAMQLQTEMPTPEHVQQVLANLPSNAFPETIKMLSSKDVVTRLLSTANQAPKDIKAMQDILDGLKLAAKR